MEINEKYLEQIESGKVSSSEEQLKESQADLDRHLDAKDKIKARIELETKLFDIVLANPKPKELTSEYQEVPEYWIYNKEIMKLEFDQKLIDFDIRLKGLERVIEAKTAEVERLKGK